MQPASASQTATDPNNDFDYTMEATKVYCEDDYFAEFNAQNYHPKCVASLQTVVESPQPFNYIRFNEYLQTKFHIERFNRAVEASNGIISPGLEYFTDERLYDELCAVYGGYLDEQNERFLLLFQNYKEQRLEQINEWIKMEEQLLLNGQCPATLEELKFIDEAEYLKEQFSEEELISFRAVATGGNGNPFKIPKKTVSNHEDKINNTCSRSSTKSNKKRNKGHLTQRNELIISEVQSIVSCHPMGIGRNKLLQLCNERLGRKAPPEVILVLNSEMIDGFLTKEKILYTKKLFLEGDMVFPVQKQISVTNVPCFFPTGLDPLEYLWDFRHKLLAILNLSYGIIEISECIHLYSQIFQRPTFPFNDWGFDTDVDLLKWLFVQKWSAVNVELIQLNLGRKGNYGGGGNKYYLAVMTDETKKLVEKLAINNASVGLDKKACSKTDINFTKSAQHVSASGSKNKKIQNAKNITAPLMSQQNDRKNAPPVSSSVPAVSSWSKEVQRRVQKPPVLNYDSSATFIDSQFVQVGSKIVREQDEITPGSQINCMVSRIESPTNFYLVNLVKWNQLDTLFIELRKYWNDHPRALSPHPQFLQKGYLCMAKTDEEGDVYRVVVFGKSDPDHYQVYCYDYGDMLQVRLDQLRYLPKDLLYRLDAQAIPCALYNVASSIKNPKTGHDVWSKEVCEYTQKLLNPVSSKDPIVTVLFKQRLYGTGKWLVKLSWEKRSDFGEDIMKFVNKRKS